jgi:hypothetical protein
MTLTNLYNLCCVFPHGPRNSGSHFSKEIPMTASSSSFYQTEFQRALEEQAFGIKSFAMVSSSSHQATASIVILEGSKLLVQLTTQGYSVGVLLFPGFVAASYPSSRFRRPILTRTEFTKPSRICYKQPVHCTSKNDKKFFSLNYQNFHEVFVSIRSVSNFLIRNHVLLNYAPHGRQVA